MREFPRYVIVRTAMCLPLIGVHAAIQRPDFGVLAAVVAVIALFWAGVYVLTAAVLALRRRLRPKAKPGQRLLTGPESADS